MAEKPRVIVEVVWGKDESMPLDEAKKALPKALAIVRGLPPQRLQSAHPELIGRYLGTTR